MKKLYPALLVFLLFFTSQAQIINIPDVNFKARLLAASPSNAIASNNFNAFIKIDANDDNETEVSEALQVKSLDVSVANIYSMTGIEVFTNLRTLDCSQNHIATLDINTLTNLKSLYCNLNLLSSLNLSGLTHLINLECAENVLTQLDFADAVSIQTLSCRFNFLTSLAVNELPNLTSLNCDYNQLTTLAMSNLSLLTNLECQSNQFQALDLSSLVNLIHLNCSFNQLTALDLTGIDGLTILNCSHNQITALDLSGVINLTLLNCEYNQIGNPFVLSGMPNLQSVYCHNNLIPSFVFTDLLGLEILDCSTNQMTTLDVSALPVLSLINCHDNAQLEYLNIKNGNNEPFLDFSNNPSLLTICADEGQLTTVENLITQYGYTNCEVNTLCNLVTPDFAVTPSFRAYPNPVKSKLQWETEMGLLVKAIAVYNLLGQRVVWIPNAEHISTLEVADLKSGTYFIKVTTDKGTANTTFIKE